MGTFLFASIPVPAHTANPLPFATRLIERGHRVLWYSGEVFHRQIAAIGAEPLPYVHAEDFGGKDLTAHWPAYQGLSPLQTIRHVFADVFVGQAAARVADLRQIVAGTRVDAMLCDGLMVGVGAAHRVSSIRTGPCLGRCTGWGRSDRTRPRSGERRRGGRMSRPPPARSSL